MLSERGGRWKRGGGRRRALAVLMLAAFLLSLQDTAAAVALPTIGRGAVLTEQLGWSWIFLANVPLVVLALAIVPGALRRDVPLRDLPSLDMGGGLLSAIALAGGIFALTEGGFYGWTSPSVLAAAAVTLLAAAAFVAVERRLREPLVQLTLFRARAFAGANLVTLLSTAVMCSVLFFMSLYLQLALGYSPLRAGLAFLPMTATIVVAAPLAGALADRIGPRVPAVGGMLALALGLLGLAQLGVDGSFAATLVSLALIGVGAGLTTTPVTAAALDALPPERSGEAAAIVTTFRMIGLAVGIAGMGALVALRWPSGFASAGLPAAGLGDGLADAFTINALLSLATAALAYFTLGRASAKEAGPIGRVRADSNSNVRGH